MTLGCKVNQYDAQALREEFLRRGFESVGFDEVADVYVVASCAVTGGAAARSRQMTRRARRMNEKAVVVLAGCYPQAEATRSGENGVDRLENLPADLLLGVGQTGDIVESVLALLQEDDVPRRQVVNPWSQNPSTYDSPRVSSYSGHSRALVKIQEGCDEFCAYCLIPYLRGPVRGRPPGEIVAEVKRLVDGGFREVVLTGIHLGAYERCPEIDETLPGLLERLLQIPGRWRLRLSSVEPMDLDDRLFQVMASSSHMARHLHLPLQSGTCRTLERMGRRYTPAQYYELVDQARGHMPDLGVSTDLMVGFPGEEEEDHRQTLDFVRKIRFSRIHAFPFSVRPGTRAARMADQVPPEVIRRRRDEVLRLARDSAATFHQEQVDQPAEVLLEDHRDEHPFDAGPQGCTSYYGYTGNYVPTWVLAPDGEFRVGQILRVQVLDAIQEGCLAVPLGSSGFNPVSE